MKPPRREARKDAAKPFNQPIATPVKRTAFRFRWSPGRYWGALRTRGAHRALAVSLCLLVQMVDPDHVAPALDGVDQIEPVRRRQLVDTDEALADLTAVEELGAHGAREQPR